MIEMKVMKKDLSDALTIAKRVIPKNGMITLAGKGQELLIFAKNDNLEVLQYCTLNADTTPFAFAVDPTIIDKWLDKANRELVFEIRKEEFYSQEKKLKTKIKSFNPAFKDVRSLEYNEFVNQELFMKALSEISLMFQKSERRYSEFLKITDINITLFDPLLLSNYFLQEKFGILNKFGTEGLGFHKDAIDSFLKSIKKPKELLHNLQEESFLIKDGNTVFAFKFNRDITFPDARSIKPLNASPFSIDVDSVKESLKQYPQNKVNKIRFAYENGVLRLNSDNDEYPESVISHNEYVPNGAFNVNALKSFVEGLSGTVNVNLVQFDSKTTQDGYLWMYRDLEKSKLMPGILEASGF